MQKITLNTSATDIQKALQANIHSANTLYIARTPEAKLNLNNDGVNPNLATAIKLIEKMPLSGIERLRDTYQLDFNLVIESFKTVADIKNILRIPQFMSFLSNGDTAMLTASAKVALLAFASGILGARNRPGVMQSLTGKAHKTANDTGYDHPAYERASKLVDKLNGGRANKIKPSTALRQLEVAVGAGGVLPSLGITKVMPRGGEFPEIIDCVASRALVAVIESTTDQTMDLWSN